MKVLVSKNGANSKPITHEMQPKELKACDMPYKEVISVEGGGLILVPRDQPKSLLTWTIRLTNGSSQKPIYWAEDANSMSILSKFKIWVHKDNPKSH